MRLNDVACVAIDGAMLSRPAARTISFGGLFHGFAEPAVLSPRHGEDSAKRAFKPNGEINPF
jgi:hypothetical protein